MEQMWGAVAAVFGSWMNDRAIVYRRQYGIPHDWGTAANICSMVFGNMGDDCGTGVAFTRDPATGENVFYGEYLINAQGEDVVAGIRTPKKIAELQEGHAGGLQAARRHPRKLEKHYRDVQDIEFTVQKGKLWMLQTRNGKRTGFAGRPHRRRHGRGGADHEGGGPVRRPHPAGRPQPAPAADLRPRRASGKGKVIAKGINAGPGRRHRRSSSSSPTTPRRRRQARQATPTASGGPRHPRPPRDQPRGHPRHAGGRRHPDRLRRRVQPRRPGQPADGQGLRRRLRRPEDRLQRRPHRVVGDKVLKEGDFITIDGFTGEVIDGRSRPSRARSCRCSSTRR